MSTQQIQKLIHPHIINLMCVLSKRCEWIASAMEMRIRQCGLIAYILCNDA